MNVDLFSIFSFTFDNYKITFMIKRLSLIVAILTSIFFNFTSYSCTVDVSILQGSAISLCPNSQDALTASAGYVQYTWIGPVVGNGSSGTAMGNGWIYVEAKDGVGCISKDSILVTLYASPISSISSSEGLNVCPSAGGTTLSLNQAYTSYLWSDGSTNPTLFITQPGQYGVTISDANGCIDSSSLNVSFIEFSLNAVGGTKVCSGSYLLLEAQGGDVYAWSTNEFTSSIVVAPAEQSTYSVTIYKGACHETLSTTIDIIELPRHSLPDTVYFLPGEVSYVFGPPDFDTYTWSPATYLTDSTGVRTGYKGTSDGSVTLVATSNSLGCSIGHTIFFKMIDIIIPEGFSPNGDGINDNFEILKIHDFKAAFKAWNRWGDLVFETDLYRNEWDGTCQTGFCIGKSTLPEGTYYYKLTIEGYDFNGFLTLKK